MDVCSLLIQCLMSLIEGMETEIAQIEGWRACSGERKGVSSCERTCTEIKTNDTGRRGKINSPKFKNVERELSRKEGAWVGDKTREDSESKRLRCWEREFGQVLTGNSSVWWVNIESAKSHLRHHLTSAPCVSLSLSFSVNSKQTFYLHSGA